MQLCQHLGDGVLLPHLRPDAVAQILRVEWRVDLSRRRLDRGPSAGLFWDNVSGHADGERRGLDQIGGQRREKGRFK